MNCAKISVSCQTTERELSQPAMLVGSGVSRLKPIPLVSRSFSLRLGLARHMRQAAVSMRAEFSMPAPEFASKLSVAARPTTERVPVTAPCIPEKQSYALTTSYKTQEIRATGV